MAWRGWPGRVACARRRRPAASCRRYNQSGSPIFVDAELLAFVLHKETVRESGLVAASCVLARACLAQDRPTSSTVHCGQCTAHGKLDSRRSAARAAGGIAGPPQEQPPGGIACSETAPHIAVLVSETKCAVPAAQVPERWAQGQGRPEAQGRAAGAARGHQRGGAPYVARVGRGGTRGGGGAEWARGS